MNLRIGYDISGKIRKTPPKSMFQNFGGSEKIGNHRQKTLKTSVFPSLVADSN